MKRAFSVQNKTISARAVYFNRNIKNGIDYNYVTYQYFNYIKQKVKGTELEVRLKPNEYITVTANYTFLSPKETSQNRITNYDTVTYHYLLRRPNHSLNATIGVQPFKPLYISFSGKYVSKRYDVGGYMSPDVKLKDYIIFSAYSEYKLKKIQFFLCRCKTFLTANFMMCTVTIPFLSY